MIVPRTDKQLARLKQIAEYIPLPTELLHHIFKLAQEGQSARRGQAILLSLQRVCRQWYHVIDCKNNMVLLGETQVILLNRYLAVQPEYGLSIRKVTIVYRVFRQRVQTPYVNLILGLRHVHHLELNVLQGSGISSVKNGGVLADPLASLKHIRHLAIKTPKGSASEKLKKWVNK